MRDALLKIRAGGVHFQLAAMVGHGSGPTMRSALVEAGIAERTLIRPFLPNCRVPEFIRACTAVCFLERGFRVALHGPMVAREVGVRFLSDRLKEKSPTSSGTVNS